MVFASSSDEVVSVVLLSTSFGWVCGTPVALSIQSVPHGLSITKRQVPSS
jgi:hypothetical protein